MNQALRDIYDQYELLLPLREDGIIIFLLHNKIENKEIDSNFTYQDIQQAIKEAIKIEVDRQPQTERVLKNLLHNFIERPAGKKNRYKLTNYAIKFTQFVNNKINNPYRKFPLRESFKKYTDFRAEEIKSIEFFESWYEQGFNSTTKQNIIEHLEALKDDVSLSLKNLNKVLYSEENDISKIVRSFSEIFKNLGLKAEEIKDTLRLGNSLEQELQKVTTSFYEKIERFKHPENESEMNNYVIYEQNYHRAINIQDNVKDFFLVIDEKLGQLREKIVFASSKLNELHDNFRYQSRFKINLKKFLEFTLIEAKFSKEGPVLPNIFPRKLLPFEETQYLIVQHYEFNQTTTQTVKTIEKDPEYEAAQKQLIDIELVRQEDTAKWVRTLKEKLKQNSELDFTKSFYEIQEENNDIELGLQVGFELFQFASQSKEYQIHIDREFIKGNETKNILIWKMNISKKSNTNSHS